MVPSRVLEQTVGVTHVRGVLIGASTLTLRHNGLHAAYQALLDAEYRELLAHLPPSSWVGIDVAEAHYRGCDALALSEADTERNAAGVLDRTQRATLATISRGVTQRMVRASVVGCYLPRVWNRMFKGGSLRAKSIGPRALMIESHGLSLFKSRYFRTGFRVHLKRGLETFVDECRVQALASAPGSGRFLVSWGEK
jgi:hypothetical protein